MPTPSPTTDKEIIYVQSPYAELGYQGDEIDLIDLWNIIWRGKWFIILFTLGATLISVYLCLFVLPDVYKSDATLIPAQQGDSSVSSRLGGLIGNLPISLPGNKGPSNIMSFLESRTLKERLISKYELLPILYKDSWDEDTKKWQVDDPHDKPTIIKALQSNKLEKVYSISQDKKTELITLSWESEDPSFCHQMLIRIIDELLFFLEHEYVSDSKNEREFIEKQLAAATKELEYWERQIPNEEMTLSKITRERLANQAVYTELRKQLELAKIAEAKELESFKVLDKPFIPEQRFKPKRRLIVTLTFLSSGFIALLFVFFRNFLQNINKEALPKEHEKSVL